MAKQRINYLDKAGGLYGADAEEAARKRAEKQAQQQKNTVSSNKAQNEAARIATARNTGRNINTAQRDSQQAVDVFRNALESARKDYEKDPSDSNAEAVRSAFSSLKNAEDTSRNISENWNTWKENSAKKAKEARRRASEAYDKYFSALNQTKAAQPQSDQQDISADDMTLRKDMIQIGAMSEQDRQDLQIYSAWKENNLSGLNIQNSVDVVWVPGQGIQSVSPSMQASEAFSRLRAHGFTEQRINELSQSYSRYANAQTSEQLQQGASEMAEKNPVLANAARVATNLAGGISGSVDYGIELLQGLLDKSKYYKSMDPNLQGGALSQISDSIYSTTRQNIESGWSGKAGGVLYGAATSLADNIARFYAGGGTKAITLGMAGANAFQEAVSEKSAAGGTVAQAGLKGVVDAASEVLTELIPLDNIIKLKTSDIGTVSNLLKEVLKNAGTEIATEEINYAVGLLSDWLIMGDKSDANRQKRALIADGYSEKEANKKVVADILTQAGMLALETGLSSGAQSGIEGGFNLYRSRKANNANTDTQDSAPAEQEATAQTQDQNPQAETPEQKGAQKLESLMEDAKRMQNGTFGNPAVDAQENRVYDGKNKQGGYNNAEGLQETDGAGLPGRTGTGRVPGAYDGTLQVSGQAPGTVGQRAEMVQGGIQDQPGASDSGNDIRVPEIIRVSDSLREAQSKKGIQTYVVKDTSNSPVDYELALNAGRNSDVQNGWCVTPKSAKELKDGNVRTFMNESGTVGLGIATDGDIVAVFKNKNGGPKNALDTMMPIAIEQGGDRLDCYGLGLVGVYENYGFVPVARVEFNPKYANDGWTPDKGTPYIYVMMHNGDDAATVTEKMKNYHKSTDAELDALPTFGKDEYDSAMAYRDSLIAQRSEGQNPSVGAADAGFTGYAQKYYDLLSDETAQRDRPGDVRPMEVPTKDPNGRDVSEFVGNAFGAAVTSDRFVSTIQELVVEGALGHDIKSHKETLQEAADYIKENSLAGVERKITEAAMSGKATDRDIAAAMLLWADYNQSKSENRQQKAAELFVDLQQMATSSARKLNLFNLIRKMTPQGQTQTVKIRVQRTVDILNKSRSKRNQVEITVPQELLDAHTKAAEDASVENTVSAGIARTIESTTMDEIANSADSALDKVLENVNSYVGADPANQIQTNDMAERVGKKVANKLTAQAKENNTTVEDVLYREIMKFAKEKANPDRANTNTNAQKNLDALRDYYRYRAFFQTSWNIARQKVQDAMNSMHADDQRIPILERFLYGENLMSYMTEEDHIVPNFEGLLNGQITDVFMENKNPLSENDYLNPKSTLRKATKEAANKAGIRVDNRIQKQKTQEFRTSVRDILIENAQVKEAAAKKIVKEAMDGLDLDETQARNMAQDIEKAFYADLAEQSARRVAALFSEKKTQKRVFESFSEKLDRLYNMGAFSYKEYRQAAIDSLFGRDGIDIPDSLIEKFANEDGDEKKAAEQAIYKYAASQIGSTMKEKWDAWRHMAMLGNWKTQVRNFGGNLFFKPFVTAKRAVGAAMERALDVSQEERTKAVLGLGKDANLFRQLAAQDAKSQQAADLMSYSAKTGDTARNAISEYRAIFDYKADNDASKTPQAIKKAWEQVNKGLEFGRKGITNLMESADMIFKRWEYSTSLATFLKARGYTAQQWQDGNVPAPVLEQARAYAAKEAMKATFNDQNVVSDAVSKLHYKGDNPFMKVLDTAFEGVLPYKRTPANVAVRAVEYSPVNIGRAVVNGLTKVQSGEMSAATWVDQMASGLTGTGAMLIGAALASGIFGVRLVGAQDDEDEERMGHQAYSLEFGDRSVTIDWAAPSVIPLFVGANLYRNFFGEDNGDIPAFTKLLTGLSTTFEPMLELSCLSSFADLIENVKYAKEGEALYAIAASIATSYFMQGLPTIGAQLDQLGDDTRQMVYADSEDLVTRQMQKTLGKISQRLPGDFYQTEYVDEWGRTQKTNAFESVLSPSYSKEIQDTPVELEISRLNDAQDENVSPKKPDYSFTQDGKTTRLSGEQWSELAKTQGQTAYSIVEQLIQMEQYKRLSDAEKAGAIKDAYAYAREYARVSCIDGYDDFPAAWMDGIEGNEAQTIAQRALVNSSGIGSEARYDRAVEMGYSTEQMRQVSVQVNQRLAGIENKTDYDTYRAVVDSVPKDELANWLQVYGMSESRLEDMAKAGKRGVSPSSYVDYIEAKSAVESAVSALTSAWKDGTEEPLENLSAAYKAFSGIAPIAIEYYKENNGGRAKAFIDAMDSGVPVKTFSNLLNQYWDLENSGEKPSVKADKWAAALDTARLGGLINQKQRDLLFSDLGFYSQIRQDAAKYTELIDLGVSPDVALIIRETLADLSKTREKLDAIAASDLDPEEKEAAARAYFDDDQDEKLDAMLDLGFDVDTYAALYGIYSDESGVGKKARVKAEFMRDYGLTASQAEAAYKIFYGR